MNVYPDYTLRLCYNKNTYKLVNFIICMLFHFTRACSSVRALETACCNDVADVGHYEIHLNVYK